MKLRIWQIFLAQLALVALSLIFITPFAWIVSTSFKVSDKLQTSQMQFIPYASYIERDGQPIRVKPVGVKDGKLHVQLEEGPHADEMIPVNEGELHDRVHFHVANYTDAFAW